MRMLAALLLAALISTGLVSLMAVLVLSPSPTPDPIARTRPSARPVTLTSPPRAAMSQPATPSAPAGERTMPTLSSPALPAPPDTILPAPPETPLTPAVGASAPLSLPPLSPTPLSMPAPADTAPALSPAATDTADKPTVPAARELLHRVEPRYPPQAERAGVEGMVRLRFRITAEGKVTDIQILTADPAGVFERSALQAVRRWHYAPLASPQDDASRQETATLYFRIGRSP